MNKRNKIIIGVVAGCSVAAIALGVGLGVGLSNPSNPSQVFADWYRTSQAKLITDIRAPQADAQALTQAYSTELASTVASTGRYCVVGVEGTTTLASATAAFTLTVSGYTLGGDQETVTSGGITYFCWTATAS